MRRARIRSTASRSPSRVPMVVILLTCLLVFNIDTVPTVHAANDFVPSGQQLDQGTGSAQIGVRFFPQTGYRISDDRFFDFFSKRGGLRTFGYPISRSFTLLGTQVQFFQRRIMQIQPNGSVGLLNVLDPGLLPLNAVNGATLPPFDPALVAQAPVPGSPNYSTAAIAFVRAHAPQVFNNRSVQFFTTFQNTVTLRDAFPSVGGDPRLLSGFDLEMWGLPTSAPRADPNNANFIYLRFQRGIMHFDATTGLTQGLLIGDFFKSVITGQNLPPDLEAQVAGSRFLRQFNNARPLGLNRPAELPGTDMSNAFIPQAPTPPEVGSTGIRFGMQAQMIGQPQDLIIADLYGAGFRWLKQQVRWADFEPSPGNIQFGILDGIVATANANQTPVLFSIVSSPSWARADHLTNGPPDDFNAFGNFVFALASRYRGRVRAYEIWNEENLSREWAGRPLDPGLYLDLLAVAHARIKQADPAAIVVSGALTPTGVNDGIVAVDDVAYLRGMYTARGGAFPGLADAVGAHMSGFNNAPGDFVNIHTVNTVGFKNHPSFYFRRIDQLHDVMVANHDGRQMWITEYEWASTTPPVPAGFEWTTQLSEQQVASFLVQSIQSIRASRPWVGAIFIWNLNFRTFLDPHNNEQAIFGILDPGFAPRPMYIALADMPK